MKNDKTDPSHFCLVYIIPNKKNDIYYDNTLRNLIFGNQENEKRVEQILVKRQVLSAGLLDGVHLVFFF